MRGNPTAGILLLLAAAALIVLGLTDKGKQIISVLKGGTSQTTFTEKDDISKYTDNGKKVAGSAADPDYYNPSGTAQSASYTPGAYAGEKAAIKT